MGLQDIVRWLLPKEDHFYTYLENLAAASHEAAILLVEHNVGFVMQRCHRVVVLHLGKVLADGTPEQVREDPLVLSAYLGASTS